MSAPKEIGVRTSQRCELVNVTAQVHSFLKDAKARNGTLVLFVPHTTAGVTINENADPDVARDIIRFTGGLIPERSDFRHSEGNSDAHIKSSLFSPSLTLIIQDGAPCLGTWQGIYFAEFDGPRSRKLWLKYQPDFA